MVTFIDTVACSVRHFGELSIQASFQRRPRSSLLSLAPGSCLKIPPVPIFAEEGNSGAVFGWDLRVSCDRGIVAVHRGDAGKVRPTNLNCFASLANTSLSLSLRGVKSRADGGKAISLRQYPRLHLRDVILSRSGTEDSS